MSPGLSATYALLHFNPKTIGSVHLYISLATQKLNILVSAKLGGLVGSIVYFPAWLDVIFLIINCNQSVGMKPKLPEPWILAEGGKSSRNIQF